MGNEKRINFPPWRRGHINPAGGGHPLPPWRGSYPPDGPPQGPPPNQAQLPPLRGGSEPPWSSQSPGGLEPMEGLQPQGGGQPAEQWKQGMPPLSSQVPPKTGEPGAGALNHAFTMPTANEAAPGRPPPPKPRRRGP